MLDRNMNTKYHTIQFPCPRTRGPGTSFMASIVARPVTTVWRPNSTCTNTLMMQPMRISHSSQKPASAPVFVVAISSPDPTIDPAMISPGPSRQAIPKTVVGAGSTSADESWNCVGEGPLFILHYGSFGLPEDASRLTGRGIRLRAAGRNRSAYLRLAL